MSANIVIGTEPNFRTGSSAGKRPAVFLLSALRAVLVAVVSLAGLSLPGCGSGGGESVVSPVSQGAAVSMTTSAGQAAASPITTNYLQIAASDYPFAVTPNFYYSTDNQSFWSIQANVAKTVSDIDSRSVIRIDIQKSGAPLPQLNRTFSIEAGGNFERFPGSFMVHLRDSVCC